MGCVDRRRDRRPRRRHARRPHRARPTVASTAARCACAPRASSGWIRRPPGRPARHPATPSPSGRSGIWWITYDADGRRHHVSFHSEDRQVADDLLQARARHAPPAVAPSAPQRPVTFDDAANEIVADYQMNKKRSLRTLRIRIEKHLRQVVS